MNYQALLNLYRGLSTRERVLVAATLLALTWGIWLSTFGGSLMDRVTEVDQRLNSARQQLAAASVKFTTLQQQGGSSELTQLKQQRQDLLDDVEIAQGELDQLLARFVPPEDVPLLLEDLLDQHADLQLTSLHSEASEKITVTLQEREEDVSDVDTQLVSTMDVYRHPFQLELAGNFHDVVSYLYELEHGSWQFQWRSLDYVVEEFPTAKIVLRIETLSRSADWIGV